MLLAQIQGFAQLLPVTIVYTGLSRVAIVSRDHPWVLCAVHHPLIRNAAKRLSRCKTMLESFEIRIHVEPHRILPQLAP